MPSDISWKQVFRIWLFALPVMAGLLFVIYHKSPKVFQGAGHWAPQAAHMLTMRINSVFHPHALSRKHP